jgi:hypothetical protein
MKKGCSSLVRAAAATIIALGLNSGPVFASDSIPQIVAKSKPATILIIALDENWSPIKTGTGFFISPDGLAVTNYHVVQGASHFLGRTNEGAAFQFERLVAHPQGVDLAILKFAADGVACLKLGHSTDAVEGQTVLVIGSPEGLQGTVTEGIISAFRENRSMIQISAPISPGSSGSPVMDESGDVIGVATSITREGQDLGFAIAVEEVERALTAPRVAIETPSEPPLVDPTPAPSVRASNSASFIAALSRAFDNHNWQTITSYTISGSVNYFGHLRASNAFIRQDMQGDARTYRWERSTVYPDTFTHEVSEEYSSRWDGPMVYDSITVYTEALENNGHLHKAKTRLTVGYTFQDQHISIYALVLKML